MNAISKRLLSFVVVLAMVLAMAPAITFSAAAATTDDIDSWITAFEAAEAAGDVSTITTCPFCSGTEVTWTAKSGAVNGNQEANKFSGHYYLSDNYSASGSSRAIWLAGNACCYLNGYSVSNTSSAGYSLISTSSYAVNIFGDGNVTNNGTSWMFDFNGSGLVNIYGGTYTHNGTTADKLMFENNALSGVSTHAMIYGGKFNVNVGTFDEDNSYTYNNVQIAEGMEVTDNGDGTWTVAEPEPFVPPAECPCCGVAGEDLEWTAISAPYEGKPWYVSSSGVTKHVYLAKDITVPDTYTSLFLNAYNEGGCLYLNGKTLTYNGTGTTVFRTGSLPLTIFGDGEVINNGSGYMFDFNGAGIVNIYGGTYTHNGTDATKLMFENNALSGVSTHAMIYGGTFNVNVGTYDEDNSFTNNNVQIADGYEATDNGNGTWTVAEIHVCDWDEGVETTPATCTTAGVMTYTCSGCGETKEEPIEALGHDFSANGPTCANCEEANPDYIVPPSFDVCPGCGANAADITWTALSGSYGSQQSQAGGHYFLSGDYTQTGGGRLIYLSGDACLYLNGKNMSRTNTAPSYAFIDAGYYVLNIFGEGNVTDAAENDKNMFSYGGDGTIHVYGGNYTFNGTGNIFRDYTYIGSAASHVVLHGGTFNVNLNELKSGKTTFTLATGMEVADNLNGTWTVKTHTCVWDEGKVTEPTCTTAGYTTYTCACGNTYTADEVPALGHSYEATVTAPTCTAAGYTTYTCACGDTYTADEVAALGHSYEATVTEPTCTTAGYTTYTCACGDTYTADEVAALGHSYEATVTEPTCTAAGYTTYTCACGDTYTDNEVPALDHSFTNYVSDGNATCTENGTETAKCDRCDATHTRTEENSAKGHSYDNNFDNECNVCGAPNENYTAAVAVIGTTNYATLQDAVNAAEAGDTIEMVRDTEVETAVVVDKAVTINLNGKTISISENDTVGDGVFHVVAGGNLTINGDGKIDAVGGSAYCMAIWADGGKVTINGGTYTNVGAGEETQYDLIYAKNGGEVIINGGYFISETPAWTLNCHDASYKAGNASITVNGGEFYGFNPFNNAAEGKNTNFAAAGLHYADVDGDGIFTKHAVQAVVDAAVAPTCTATGLTEGAHCEICDYVIVAQEEVAALGHSYEATVTAPTCTAAGYTTYTCACGDTYTADEVAALGHSYEAIVTAPTCGVAGYTTYTCACGDTYTADEVPALEHSYENGSCIHCGDTPTGVVITEQPVDVLVKDGVSFKVTVIAQGDGLTYSWYYKDAGATEFALSSVKTNSYGTLMRDAIDGRQIYCVVTDEYGNVAISDTVTLSMKSDVIDQPSGENPPLITKQPTDVKVTNGTSFKVTVSAEGDDLTYLWYYKDAGDSKFTLSSVKTNSYGTVMRDTVDGREVYCVVIDKDGNTSVSNTVTLSMLSDSGEDATNTSQPPIIKQPTDVEATNGTAFKVTVIAEGDDLTYRWYYKDAGDSKFTLSSVKTNVYSTVMRDAIDGRQIYCIVADKDGNTVKSETVTLSMK